MEKCYYCGEIYDIEDMLQGADENLYCKNCYGDRFGVCYNCEETFYLDDLQYDENNGVYYCEDCFYEQFGECYYCGEIYDIEDMLQGADENLYCKNCYGDRFGVCYNCEETFYLDDLQYDENNGVYYCEDCYNEICIIKNYSYVPSQFIFKKEKWENTLYLGIELEVENKSDDENEKIAEEIRDYLGKNSNLFYFKWDGSLRNGFEIISHPLTLQSHKKINYKNFLKFLKKYFTSYDDGTCGLHIHLNKDFFTEEEIKKMKLFFTKNRRKIKQFSKRTKDQIENYCHFEEIKDILENYQQDRHVAINKNTGKNTIEIRIFRGTLSYERFWASLQFADAIAHFIKLAGFTSFFKPNWEDFVNWCRQINRYKFFLDYMKKERLLCA